MKKVYTTCLALALHEQTQQLFAQGLKFLMDNAELYDRCVPEDNPFCQEFTRKLQEQALCEDDCFSLFECLVIFVRLKQLTAKDQPLNPVEQQILDHFEHCGQWNADDGTLVSLWYWWRIPALALMHQAREKAARS